MLLVVFGIAGIGAAYQAIGRAADTRRHPPPGELVEVGGGRLHLLCLGEGGPTTILDAGGGDTSLVWTEVQAELARDVRVCSFDRAGFGWSDAFDRPHTVESYVELQERLLDASGLPAPYLLVGHSLGGLNAQVFAARNPDDVAGLVLVDAAHPELLERVPELIDAQRGFVTSMRLLSRIGVVRLALDAGWVDPLYGMRVPPEVHAPYHAEFARPRHWDSVHQMGTDLARGMAAVRDVGAPPEVPTIVLAHDVPDQFEGLSISADEVGRLWQELQAELASRFDHGRLEVVAGSGHMIPIEAPGAVIEAVRALLDEGGRPHGE